MKKSTRGRSIALNFIDKKPLAKEVARILEQRGLSQADAAEIMDDAASQVSLVVNGHLSGFSAERLIRMLMRLGRNVEIRIAKGGRKTGRVGVRVA